MTARPSLPALPDRDLLADLCREAASRERLQPHVVEKDFYLTRLLWALGQTLGEQVLLKGGTLLSKVDLGFKRMSEDVDLVMPRATAKQRANVLALNDVRDVLRSVVDEVGLKLPLPDGAHFEQGAHRQWDLPYESAFGPQAIKMEVSLRPTIRQARRVSLAQLLVDPLVGSYASAFCYALDADEARAEKVRAAFTRDAIRDLYDLEQLARAGADLSSTDFVRLVDAKLAELGAPPLRGQARSFRAGTGPRRKALETSVVRELQAVLRVDEPPLDLENIFERFNRLWGLT
ncbi:MAG TPA: nucleotidyl transferase AbiEii/AbiGii toxin family protein [Polyangiaceae bacterium]|jgi:predicted nucleotidyltransferase component of viral defense system